MLGLLEEPRNLNIEGTGDLQDRQLRKVGGRPKDARSVRAGAGEVLFEVLDDKLKVVGTFDMADFEGALEDRKKFRSPQA